MTLTPKIAPRGPKKAPNLAEVKAKRAVLPKPKLIDYISRLKQVLQCRKEAPAPV